MSAPLCGTINSAVGLWMKGKALTFAALEVGTQSLRDVFDALRMDNWLHAHARLDHKNAKSIKKKIRAAFYPDTAEWKRKVFKSADSVVDKRAHGFRLNNVAGNFSAKDAKNAQRTPRCASRAKRATSFYPRKKYCALPRAQNPWRPSRDLRVLRAKNLYTSLLSNI